MPPSTCNYCHKQMPGAVELEKYRVPVCTNPECPVYGLLQIAKEKLTTYREE